MAFFQLALRVTFIAAVSQTCVDGFRLNSARGDVTCPIKAAPFSFEWHYTASSCMKCNPFVAWNEQLLKKVFDVAECESADFQSKAQCKPYASHSNGKVCSCIPSDGISLLGFRMSSTADAECSAESCFRKFAWLHEKKVDFQTKFNPDVLDSPRSLCEACRRKSPVEFKEDGCDSVHFGLGPKRSASGSTSSQDAVTDAVTAVAEAEEEGVFINSERIEDEDVSVASDEDDEAEKEPEHPALAAIYNALDTGDKDHLEQAIAGAEEAEFSDNEDVQEAREALEEIEDEREASAGTEAIGADEEDDLEDDDEEEVGDDEEVEGVDDEDDEDEDMAVEVRETDPEEYEFLSGVTTVREIRFKGAALKFRAGSRKLQRRSKKFLKNEFTDYMKAALAKFGADGSTATQKDVTFYTGAKFVFCPHVGSWAKRKNKRTRRFIKKRGETIKERMHLVLHDLKLNKIGQTEDAFGHFRTIGRRASIVYKVYFGKKAPKCKEGDLVRFENKAPVVWRVKAS